MRTRMHVRRVPPDPAGDRTWNLMIGSAGALTTGLYGHYQIERGSQTRDKKSDSWVSAANFCYDGKSQVGPTRRREPFRAACCGQR